jgi:hypothetical protein
MTCAPTASARSWVATVPGWFDRSLLLIPTTAFLPMDAHKGHDVCAVEEHLVPDGS